MNPFNLFDIMRSERDRARAMSLETYAKKFSEELPPLEWNELEVEEELTPESALEGYERERYLAHSRIAANEASVSALVAKIAADRLIVSSLDAAIKVLETADVTAPKTPHRKESAPLNVPVESGAGTDADA